MTATSFDKQCIDIRERFNRSFKLWLQERQYPCARLKQAVMYSCLNGGKRFRPLLVLYAGAELSIPEPILIKAATAIELIHCYSLIHDDLPAMDDDNLRRGQPTCHIAFDEATAILVGDLLQAFAIEALIELQAELPAENVLAMTTCLAKSMSDMVCGQSLDITSLTTPDLTLEALKNIHQLKTGALIKACCALVIAANTVNNPSKSQALMKFANLLGLTFQIQDDYLDRYGDSQKLGKRQGSDQSNNKRTYCDFYSQHELENLLDSLFDDITKTLAVFGDDNALQGLTKQLSKREH